MFPRDMRRLRQEKRRYGCAIPVSAHLHRHFNMLTWLAEVKEAIKPPHCILRLFSEIRNIDKW
jgi:hypothetical protein